MNKKAQVFDVARKSIYWMLAGLIIAAVVLIFAFSIAGYRNKLTKIPPELSAELIALRFTTIPDCFAVEDSGVVLSGTIDQAKFTTETINHCYKTEPEKGFKTFNFRLKLESTGQELITNNYFHQDRDDLTITKEVLVKTEQGLQKDHVTIYVQEKIGS